MFAMSMSAQTVESSRFIDNTYFRLEGGATALTHPGCLGYEDWGHTIQGVIGAEIGKWITPKFGVAFEGDFGIRNGSKFGYFNYEWVSVDAEGLDVYQKAKRFNYINVTGLVKFNMSNIFAGWNPNRKWELVLATGPMWIHGFPGKNYENDFGVKFKAEVNYNINYRWQLNLIPEFNYNLTGLYSYGTYEHPRFDSRNSWYGLKVGVTYKIGKQFTECPYRYTQEDVDKLNAEINDHRARQPEVIERIVEKVVTKEVGVQNVYVVAFDYGKADLDQTGRDVLNAIPTDIVVDVQGEASNPGTKEYNQKLSERRASAVADYLTNRGVKVADCKGAGATGHQIVKIVVK
jgi:outer membrane protein OmpA-like peptidoglycan-associated protein